MSITWEVIPGKRQKPEGETNYGEGGQYERVSVEDYDLKFKNNTALLTQEIVASLDKASESVFLADTASL